ncbi:MAG: cell division inhibitor-like protein [Gammaproteobacteria bacterium]|jgi:uncharacterized protein (TIGR01777 family)|nr:cell division inhibitor-like protein [Gammaproteobacteria bacterium]
MTKQVKNFLITGGTGFIGKALSESLLKHGYIIYILTRNKNLNSERSNQEKNYINNLSEIQNIDIDIIINLAGETISKRWTEDAKKRIYSSRIVTTRDLVNYMRSKKTKPTLFISGSAVGYYGTDLKKTFNEEDSASNVNPQFASSLCKAWEDEASQAVALGVRTVFLRIGPVLEKDGGILKKLLPSFYLGLGSQIGDGKQWLSWIDRYDLIKLILFIIHQQNIDGPINATSPNPVTNKEFSCALAKALKRPCFLKIPGFILKLIFDQMADEIMVKGQKVLPQKALIHGFEFSYPTIEQSFEKIFRS